MEELEKAIIERLNYLQKLVKEDSARTYCEISANEILDALTLAHRGGILANADWWKLTQLVNEFLIDNYLERIWFSRTLKELIKD